MKLDYKKTFYIALAFFLITLFWRTYDLIIAKILIDKFGLNQTWSGVVFLIPLFGALSDKQKSKYGKRTPYIVIGTIIAAFVFMSLTFSDNVQKAKLEAETTVVEDYNQFIEQLDENGELSYSQWVTVKNVIIGQWDELLAEGVITQAKYDKFYEDVIDGDDADDVTDSTARGYVSDHREGINEILLYSGGTLDKDDNTDLKEYYYDNLNERAWVVTSHSPGTFIVFMGTLLIATYRSPAVALMPDVTIKPLRSKANAVINLMGTVGGIIATGVLWVYNLDKLSYVSYAPAFITIGVMMLILLGLFLWKVKEPKLVKAREDLDARLGLIDIEKFTKLKKGKRNLFS